MNDQGSTSSLESGDTADYGKQIQSMTLPS